MITYSNHSKMNDVFLPTCSDQIYGGRLGEFSYNNETKAYY